MVSLDRYTILGTMAAMTGHETAVQGDPDPLTAFADALTAPLQGKRVRYGNDADKEDAVRVVNRSAPAFGSVLVVLRVGAYAAIVERGQAAEDLGADTGKALAAVARILAVRDDP